MNRNRRTVLVTAGGVLVAGCAGDGPETVDGSPPTTDGQSPTGSVTATGSPACNPNDVERPPVPDDTNIDGRPYPSKPETLSEESILLYLDDFETSYAWNRILQLVEGTVTSLTVDNLEGFSSSDADGGYRASSAMRASYSTEDDESDEREYVANYYVSDVLVYRVESEEESVDPRTDENAALVQCGPAGADR